MMVVRSATRGGESRSVSKRYERKYSLPMKKG